MPFLNLDHSSSVSFLFNSSTIAFLSGVAKLSTIVHADILYMAEWRTSINGTYSRYAGSLTNVATGTVTVSGGKVDLTAAGSKRLDIPVYNNAPIGQVIVVKFKVTPNYSGTPPTDQHFFSVGANRFDDSNRCKVSHHTNGRLLFFTQESTTGTEVVHDAGIWAPTAGTEYEIEYHSNYNSPGDHRLFLDGALMGANTAVNGIRHVGASYFRTGLYYDVAGGEVANYKIRDLMVYDVIQHTSAYTSGYTLPAIYSATSQSIQSNTRTLVSAWTAFSTTQSASGSDTVKHSPIINGVRKYWNGSAWATAIAGQSNTVAEINTNCASLITTGDNATIDLMSYLTSSSGATTPTLTSALITYNAPLSISDYPVESDVRDGIIYENGASEGTLVTSSISQFSFNEDASLDAFFADMGVPVTWTDTSALAHSETGLLDKPDQIDGSVIISTEYLLTLKASVSLTLIRGTQVTVGGVVYIVRESPRFMDDGALVQMELTKV